MVVKVEFTVRYKSYLSICVTNDEECFDYEDDSLAEVVCFSNWNFGLGIF